MSIAKRLRNGTMANLYSQFVTFFSQIATVPFFIHSVGLGQYAQWLVLTALPTYVALSDMGISSAASNVMSLRSSTSDADDHIARTFASSWYLVATLNLVFVAILYAAFVVLRHIGFYKMDTLGASASDAITLLYLIYSAVSVQTGLLIGVYKVKLRYATGVAMNNTVRLLESVIAIAVLSFSHSLVAVASGYLIARLLGYLTLFFHVKRLTSNLSLRPALVDRSNVRSFLAPSLNFMIFSAAVNVAPQTILLFVGRVLDARSVVIFSMSRTLARVGFQLLNALSLTLWAEYSLLFGSGEITRVQQLNRKALRLGLAWSLIFVLGVGTVGNWIVYVWSHKRIEHVPLFVLLGLAFAYTLQGMWMIASTVFTSQNLHGQISRFYFGTSCVAVVTIGCLGSHLALISLVTVVLTVEIVAATFVFATAGTYLQEDIRSFARYMVIGR